MFLPKLLKYIHFGLAVVLPAVGVIILAATSPLGTLIQFTIILAAVPVYAVYSGIVFLHYYPTQLRSALVLFIPTAAVTIYSLATTSFSVGTLPLYIGLYSVLLVGLGRLLLRRLRVAAVLFFAFVCVVVIGTTTMLVLPWFTWVMALESIVIAFSFVPKLKELYALNKL